MEAGGPGGVGGGSRSDGHSPEALGCADPTQLSQQQQSQTHSPSRKWTEAVN